MGRVVSVEGVATDGIDLVVEAPEAAARTEVGGSVALDGCCLTATAVQDGRISFHAVPETLARTTIGDGFARGRRVNVEPALLVGDALGGHFVQGNVDHVGRVRSVETSGEGLWVWIDAPLARLPYCVVKGSITVDGVALTVAALDDDGFAVTLVPHTLSATTLSDVAPARHVNLEF